MTTRVLGSVCAVPKPVCILKWNGAGLVGCVGGDRCDRLGDAVFALYGVSVLRGFFCWGGVGLYVGFLADHADGEGTRGEVGSEVRRAGFESAMEAAFAR